MLSQLFQSTGWEYQLWQWKPEETFRKRARCYRGSHCMCHDFLKMARVPTCRHLKGVACLYHTRDFLGVTTNWVCIGSEGKGGVRGLHIYNDLMVTPKRPQRVFVLQRAEGEMPGVIVKNHTMPPSRSWFLQDNQEVSVLTESQGEI